jgi:hypothetical protein
MLIQISLIKQEMLSRINTVQIKPPNFNDLASIGSPAEKSASCVLVGD